MSDALWLAAVLLILAAAGLMHFALREWRRDHPGEVPRIWTGPERSQPGRRAYLLGVTLGVLGGVVAVLAMLGPR